MDLRECRRVYKRVWKEKRENDIIILKFQEIDFVKVSVQQKSSHQKPCRMKKALSTTLRQNTKKYSRIFK